jgi:hypothetical protein
VILFADNQYLNFINDSLSENLKLSTDSNFIFTRKFKTNDYEKIECLKGKFQIKNDTIYFSRNLLTDIKSQKAIIKNNYLEIVDDEACYKIKLVKTELRNKITFDSKRFKNFVLFSYCQTRDSSKFKNSIPHDLNNEEISKIDSLLRSCMKENSQLKNRNSNNYYKQCIATKNLNNEVIVWINCLCYESGFNKRNEFQRQVIDGIKDGGVCFFQVKMNLTKRTYFDLSIHGDA